MTSKAPTYTQAEKDYQLSRPNETSTHGLTEYRLTTLVIVELAVLLRMYGRKKQKIALRADDYILLVSAVFSFYPVSALQIILIVLRRLSWWAMRYAAFCP